jgi:D-sedoheptulose 7-phosphate isomerase
MQTWSENRELLHSALLQLSVTDEAGEELDQQAGFDRWQEWTTEARSGKRSLFLIGNGASAAMASHCAADLGKNAGVRCEVFYDGPLLTAVANDTDFTEVFAEPLRHRMDRGELLVAISSSGCSANIVRALEAGRNLGGTLITVSAMSPTNRIRTMGDLNFYVPATTYGLAEGAHAALLHYWVDRVIESVR